MSDINKFNLTNGKFKPNIFYSQKSKASLDSETNFPFKFVNEAELKSALKKVRRANQRKRDEEKWQQFIRSRQNRNNEDIPRQVTVSPREGSGCAGCGLTELEHKSYEETPRVGDDGAEDYQEVVDNASHTYQLGPGLTKRLQDLLSTVRRMTSVLVNPGQQQFEDEDVDRTIKRSQEFDAMFARNHLYEIQRLLKGTKQLLVGKALNTVELEAKVSAALKCVTQALQVYTKHVSKGSRVKYQQVLPIFQSITTIENLMERLAGQQSFPLRRDIDVACSYMKQVLLEISMTETKTVSVVSHKPTRVHHKHKPSADLSMYNRRHKADWRRKSAVLARARFGAPNKKYRRQSAYGPGKSGKDNEFQADLKEREEPIREKDVSHRNATRAVPEDNITTMMEMIPNEPLEDSELSLDVNTFLALKQLNDWTTSSQCIRQNTDSQGNTGSDPALAVTEDHSPTPSSPGPKPSSSRKEPSLKKTEPNSVSAKSSAREPSNVQLICLKESEHRTKPVVKRQHEMSGEKVEKDEEERVTTLTMEEETKSEIIEYQKKVSEYQKTAPHYKDGKAIGIVDRLANRILTEMVMDFQRKEMDQVIQILYNLEFQ